MGSLHFIVAVDSIVVVGCEVVGVELVEFGVMVLELDSSFAGCFCMDLGGVKQWTSSGVVIMVDVTGGFLEGAAVCDTSWMKSQMSISSIS